MLNNIAKYYPTESRIHNLHPLCKILCTLLFVTFTFLTWNLKFNIFIGILLVVIIFNTNIPMKRYLKQIINLKWLLLFIFIINIIFKTNFLINIISLLRIVYIVLYTFYQVRNQ